MIHIVAVAIPNFIPIKTGGSPIGDLWITGRSPPKAGERESIFKRNEYRKGKQQEDLQQNTHIHFSRHNSLHNIAMW